ncbi:Helix-turn-helix domain-containing protein [Halomicrobium zhouii]|uniref:Helix-turn-helix domain-containing protein n=1 Tax=Halomicrobium zhouii TaxID=767519 RepID=A0A1I6M2S3_9EURY|nr:winged helix-turn-helix domain-containing protein [Halomicrobium zhouii]SFS09938.1 Helix-turn-helix domain-containing protein [Halomicrobium zhouii]
MAAETAHKTPDPDEEDLEQYVDQRLFDDSMGTLADHTARKAALGDERRYAILFLLWDREEVARKELAAAIDDDSFDLSHHLGELVDVGLVARTGAPEGTDRRQTFYKITHLGRQEIDTDIRNITGSDPSS